MIRGRLGDEADEDTETLRLLELLCVLPVEGVSRAHVVVVVVVEVVVAEVVVDFLLEFVLHNDILGFSSA
jgi:hypothetical protein